MQKLWYASTIHSSYYSLTQTYKNKSPEVRCQVGRLGMRYKEANKAITGTRRSCISDDLHQTSLLRTTASYMLFARGDRAKVSRELNQTMLEKRISGTLGTAV